MIDQLASALWQSGLNDPQPFDELAPVLKHLLRRDVRAVLMAMREPSAAMMAAGGDKSFTDNTICGRLNASAIWKSMIDTILEDEGN